MTEPKFRFLSKRDRLELAGWFERAEDVRCVQEVAEAIVAREVAKASTPPHIHYPTCWCGQDHWDPGQ